MKITHKIKLFFIAPTIILSCSAALFSYLIAKNNIEQSMFDHLETTAHSRVAHIETFLRLHKDHLLHLSEMLNIKRFLQADTKAPDYSKLFNDTIIELQTDERNQGSLIEVFILDTTGKIIASSDTSRIGLDKSDETYFLRARSGPFIKDAHYSDASETRIAVFSVPVKDDKTNEVLGVIASKFNLDALNKITSDHTGLGRTGEIYIVNKDGYLLTDNHLNGKDFLKTKIDTQNFRECRFDKHKDKVSYSTNYMGIGVLGLHEEIPGMNWCLLAEIEKKEALAPLVQIKYFFILGILGLIVIFSVIAVVISKAIAVPIQKLHKGTEIIGGGNLDYKVGTDVQDEIGQLSRAFDEMTSHLKKTTTSIDRLNKEIDERKKLEKEKDISYKAQAVLHELLSISVRDISMIEMLQQVIELLTSFSWLALEAKGGIFLVEDDSDTLVLKAQLGLAEPIQKICAKVPFGRCLCGQAAATGQIVHADHVDERHVNTYKGMPDHGHYCVPIMSPENNIWGMIVLYLQRGHTNNETEKEFLSSVARVMSGIIERKKMSETIKEAAKEWSNTFDSITDFIFIQDKDSNIIRANKAFANAIKMKPEDIVGKKCYELVHQSNKSWPNCPFDMLKKDMKPHIQEVNDPVIGVPLLITVSPIFDDKGEIAGAVHVATDISEQKKTNTSLQELNKLKDKFLGMAAHDMRNPLTSIRGFSELLLTGEVGAVSEKQLEFLKIINNTSQEMLTMINDLLDYSMIESGRLELKFELASLYKLVEKRVELMQPLAKKKNIRLDSEFSDVPEIRLDPKRIVQAIDNIISNAIKFSPSGSRIRITIKQVDQFVELAVQDEGPGIPEEELPKLFGEFQRLSAQPTGGESSTGLGLSIARRIATAHQGNIRIKTKVGTGSTFILSLPIERRGLKK